MWSRKKAGTDGELRKRCSYTITQMFSLANLAVEQLFSKELRDRKNHFIHSFIHSSNVY